MDKTNVIPTVQTRGNYAHSGAETVEDVMAGVSSPQSAQSGLRADNGSNVQVLEAMRSMALPVICVGAVVLIWAIRIFFGL